MNLFCIGAPQTGKTTFILKRLKEWGANKYNTAAYDPDEEYDALRVATHEELIELMLNTKNKNGIFEDATYLLSTRDKDMAKLLSTARGHLKHNIVVNVHSKALFPPLLVPFVDQIYYTEVFDKEEMTKGVMGKLKENYKLYTRKDFR